MRILKCPKCKKVRTVSDEITMRICNPCMIEMVEIKVREDRLDGGN